MCGLRVASLVASLVLPLVAQGQIFKCIDDTEHVTYQDFVCPVGSEEVRLYFNFGRLEEAPDTSQVIPVQDLLPIGSAELQAKLLIARHQFENLRLLAERCDTDLERSPDEMLCFDMQTRYQLLQPGFMHFLQLDPQDLPNQQAQELLTGGVRDLEYVNNVYQRLNHEYYDR